MKLIKDLGIQPLEYIDKRTGRPDTKRMGLFECPVCSTAIRLRMSRGKGQKTCKKCRGTQNVTHGESHTKLYHVWQAMRARCSNPNNKKYPIYGGKGITVCKDWMTYEGFCKDMKEGYREGLSIDRIDSSKGYNPENCRWITLARNSSETTKRRPVIQNRVILKPTKHYEEVDRYASAKEAADTLGLVAAHITATCRGKRKTHGGFNWVYADNVALEGVAEESV